MSVEIDELIQQANEAGAEVRGVLLHFPYKTKKDKQRAAQGDYGNEVNCFKHFARASGYRCEVELSNLNGATLRIWKL